LLYNAEGGKLSKRQRSESITQFREAGASPAQIIGKTLYAAGMLPALQPMGLEEALNRVARPYIQLPRSW
jgi:hypothetical protein